MTIRELLGFVSATFVFYGLAHSALAAEDQAEPLPWKTFEVTAGAYLSTHNTSFRLDSDTLGRGTEIDFEDDLGADKTIDAIRLDANWRFFSRHRASFSIYQFKRSGSRVLDREIQFGDQVFTINTRVAAKSKLTVYKGSYAYSLFQNANFDLGLSAGVHVMDFKARIEAEGLGVSESGELLAPLPVLGVRGAYAITPRLFLKASFDVFAIKVNDVKGRFTDGLVALEYDLLENLGVGLGYNRVDFLIKADGDKFEGEMNFGYGAAMLYAKFFF